jgi:hypothetical protein
MANYYNQFSAALNVGSKGNALKAMEIYTKFRAGKEAEEDEAGYCGFECSFHPDDHHEPYLWYLWIRSDESGNTDHVTEFVTRLGKELGLKGRWGFTWAEACSKPRIDSFSGGAVVIDLETGATDYINATGWLEKALAGEVE